MEQKIPCIMAMINSNIMGTYAPEEVLYPLKFINIETENPKIKNTEQMKK